jgi:hypothetical protein
MSAERAVHYESPLVLVTDTKIDTVEQIFPALELFPVMVAHLSL